MSRKTQSIIPVNDNIAIKKEKDTYIICEAYVNGKKENAQVQWVNMTYHRNLAMAIRALPDAMLGKEEINSFEEAYIKCNEIAERLASLFDNMVSINPKPIQITVDEEIDLCQDDQ